MAFNNFPTMDMTYRNLDFILDELKALLDKISTLEDQAQEIEDINIRLDGINQQLASLANTVSGIPALCNAYTDQVNAGNLETTRVWIEQAVTELQAYINQQSQSIQVTNFFTGQKVSIQAMFDYLAAFHASGSIIYQEVAEAAKTVNQVIAFNATYAQLVSEGKTLFQ